MTVSMKSQLRSKCSKADYSLIRDAVEVSAVDQAGDKRLEWTCIAEDILSNSIDGSLERRLK